MSSFKLLPTDDEIPYGNNSLPADAMYYQRSKFKNYSIPNLVDELDLEEQLLDIIDFSRGTDYGKIDPFGNFVSIKLEHLTIVNFEGTKILVSKFLIPYLNDLIPIYQKSILFANTADTVSGLKNIKPQYSTRNQNVLYEEFKQNHTLLFQSLLNTTLLSSGKIKTLRDFFKECSVFLLERSNLSNPVTKMGLSTSIFSQVLDSGLGYTFIDGEDAGDDFRLYNQYYKDLRFKNFLQTIAKMGFIVPFKTPWILLLDLDSNYFKETCQQKINVKDKYDLFNKFYQRTDTGDYDLLTDLLFEMYGPIRRNPNLSYIEICPKTNKIVKRTSELPRNMSKEEVINIIGKENILKLYFDLRLSETRSTMSVEEQRTILKSANNKLRFSSDEAVFYINDCLNPYRQKNLTTI